MKFENETSRKLWGEKRNEIWNQGGCIPIYKLRSKQNPKRPTKSKMADKIQNGRQQIKMADM